MHFPSAKDFALAHTVSYFSANSVQAVILLRGEGADVNHKLWQGVCIPEHKGHLKNLPGQMNLELFQPA